MTNNKYWRGFEELEKDPSFEEHKHKEFKEDLPVASFEIEDDSKTHRPRRDFLKMLGFSITAATVAAGCEIPIRKAIPYVIKPEEITPGIANYYATTFTNGSDFCPVLIKTREGRPIKVEGNKLADTKGATNAIAQASVVGLYDVNRLRHPSYKGEKKTWEEIDQMIIPDLEAIARKGGQIVLLSSSILSASTRNLISELSSRYPSFRHVVYEAFSNSAMLEAAEKSFGTKAIPSYSFDKADVIVGVDCDFLNSWLSPVETTKQYIKGRKISRSNPKMSRHFQIESRMSITGANADQRYPLKPSEVSLALAALHNEIAKGVEGSLSLANVKTSLDNRKIKKMATELLNARGRGLVVCGSNNVNDHILVNSINNMLGNYGTTIDMSKPMMVAQGSDSDVMNLVTDMNEGKVDALLIHNVNPAYSLPNSSAFTKGLDKVTVTASFNGRKDETAATVDYLLPNNHFLESWGDVEAKAGSFSLQQPVIAPLFDTRQWQETLTGLLGRTEGYGVYQKNFMSSKLAGTSWEQALHDGVFTAASAGGAAASFRGDIQEAVKAIVSAGKKSDGLEVIFYKGTVGDGAYSFNPFLQELPDPISKICWENYVSMNRKTAEAEGVKQGDIVRISSAAAGHSVELPVVLQPGQAPGTLAIAVGYGKTTGGNEAFLTGANVYPFMTYNGSSFSHEVTGLSFTKVGSGARLAQTQTHHSLDDPAKLAHPLNPIKSDFNRADQILRETTLAKYKKNKYAGNIDGEKAKDQKFVEHYRSSLYPNREAYEQGHRWGMSIDLNSCIGCGSCVVACNIENNVPIVGKDEVHRAHEMHWLRIDRYYAGDEESPSVAFQPMMCQHCDNAPCENVCPVAATNHSGEGLNQMAYNRCIGTRYCANNCPFKVRRFNWFDYTANDSFYGDTILDNDSYAMMNDDLTRMVLNPDVTVRSRGVMEKCSFCVQRIQAGKLDAKNAGKKLEDGMVTTACQTACPTEAIQFGDLNDTSSLVHKEKLENERSYGLLEELRVLPSISYQTKVRNLKKDEVDASESAYKA